jgi:ribokinase
MPVHVVGNACIDTTFQVERLPLGGDTINADGSSDGFGGKGLNQAIAASRAGADVRFSAAIGQDADGERIAARLVLEGLITEGLVRLPLPTDRSAIIVDRHGENMIVSAVDCARAFDPLAATDLADRLAPGDIVVLQGNLRSDITAAVVALARQQAARVVFNASPLAESPAAWPGVVDVLVVNRHEAATLSGLPSPNAAAPALRASGAETVIITLGGDGALICDSEGERSLPAAPVIAIDTSGAGDVFCGVLAAALARGLGIVEAATVANRAAAIAVTRRGTLASCPTSHELIACFTAS